MQKQPEKRIRRTGVALFSPAEVNDFVCPDCGGKNLTWSEWEMYLWCYPCEKDQPSKDCLLPQPSNYLGDPCDD